MIRYCTPYIQHDLEKKMVFLGGPRQVGKTTLAKYLLTQPNLKGEYFNWDFDEDRRAIMKYAWQEKSPLIVFDELHKYLRWKQWIKGVYDVRPDKQRYLVTGSARLDVYRRGGDSLMGRYHYWRLHPFTLDEYPEELNKEEVLERLLTFGGFPEPFLDADEREATRWRRERFDRILKEDIRDLEQIRQLPTLMLLVDLLRDRVGGMLQAANLAQDLHIAPKTVKSWLSLIERMYIAFPVAAYSEKLPRTIQKPIKMYFYDNADATNGRSARLENLVATTLLKRLHFLEDYTGARCKLFFLRDKENREVDFVTVIDGKVEELIEVKTSDSSISTALKYYQKKLMPKRAVQIVANLKKPFDKDNIHVTNPIEYFQNPPWATAER